MDKNNLSMECIKAQFDQLKDIRLQIKQSIVNYNRSGLYGQKKFSRDIFSLLPIVATIPKIPKIPSRSEIKNFSIRFYECG